MRAQKVSRPVTAVAVNEPRDALLGGSNPSDINRTENAQVFIDKFGHRHSDAVLRNWSPAALLAMGIRPIEDGSAR